MMMSTYKFSVEQQKYPLPERNQAANQKKITRFPFDQLDIGDSFFIPREFFADRIKEKEAKGQVYRPVSLISHANAVLKPKRFVMATAAENTGWRIWRTRNRD